MAYFQIKHYCLHCGEFFILCTEFPEEHNIDATFCPKCSLRASCISVQEIITGSLDDITFSDSAVTGVGQLVEVWDMAGGHATFKLRANANVLATQGSVQHTMPYRPEAAVNNR